MDDEDTQTRGRTGSENEIKKREGKDEEAEVETKI